MLSASWWLLSSSKHTDELCWQANQQCPYDNNEWHIECLYVTCCTELHLLYTFILVSACYFTDLRPKIGGQGTDWWTVFNETQVREHGLWCQVLPAQNPADVADIGDWYYCDWLCVL